MDTNRSEFEGLKEALDEDFVVTNVDVFGDTFTITLSDELFKDVTRDFTFHCPPTP